MTAIFISHSSADNAAADKMKAWLQSKGHTSLFLDFDPEAGIRSGGDWEQTLYAAFVPAMVRINAEGSYARRRALLLDMPPRAVPLLRRFVDARLLVTDRDPEGQEIIEVAHEALLRTWPQLTTWLAEDRDKLRLLESLQRAAEEWDKGGRRPDLLIHRDGRLQDAVALLADPRFAVAEASVERAYLDACGAAQRACEAAEKARVGWGERSEPQQPPRRGKWNVGVRPSPQPTIWRTSGSALPGSSP